MKSPADWNEQDLAELIRFKQEENIQLEFKRAESLDSSDKRKAEISKDVSAFANSAGGTIVYGIAESADEPRYAEALSPIDPSKCSKEWLEQVINTRIQPRIQGVFINPVELGPSDGGKYAYVVCIPQSETAHQASDNRYYKRYNFLSVAMEDYEVRQTMGRASRAAYQVEMETLQVTERDLFKFYQLSCTIENVSELVGRDVSAVVFVPKHLIQQPDDYEVSIEGATYSRIPGTLFDGRTAVDQHPLTPHRVFFKKELVISRSLPSIRPLKAIVRVYDQFGLAQTTSFLLAIPSLSIVSTQELPSPGTIRRPNTSPF